MNIETLTNASKVYTSTDQNFNDFSFSDNAQAAFTRARKLLAKNPEIEPKIFLQTLNWIHQPINPEIKFLSALGDNLSTKYDNLLKKYEEKAWDQEDLITAFTDVIVVRFTAGVLMFKELKSFSANLQRSPAQALAAQDSYQFIIYSNVLGNYFKGRIGVCYKEIFVEEDQLDGTTILESMGIDSHHPSSDDEIPITHAAKFYDQTHPCNLARELNNEYCDLVSQFVDIKELNKEDHRLVECLQKDTGVDSFKLVKK